MENSNLEVKSINLDEPSGNTPAKKTMSEAALTANRAKAQRLQAPRTPTGKIRSASNSMKHGLYSLKTFDGFIHDNDFALTMLTNSPEQVNPITPTEVSLVHQFIHQRLRFFPMECLPARIERTLKLLHAEIKLREAWIASEENVEIEPIPDAAPLPSRPKQDLYAAVLTPDGLIPKDRLAEHLKKRKERSHRRASSTLQPPSKLSKTSPAESSPNTEIPLP